MRTADKAWIVLAGGVLAYELASPRGELLSEGVDRYRQRHPILTHLIIAYLAGHLTRRWPQPIDPLHRITTLTKRATR